MKKRTVCFILIIAAAITLFCAGVTASAGEKGIPYIERISGGKGFAYAYTGNEVVTEITGTDEDFAFSDGGWYLVSGEKTLGGDVTVPGSASLILSDGAVLSVPKGIAVSGTLNLYSQSPDGGELISGDGERSAAGLGGEGEVNVYGGNITLRGGDGFSGADVSSINYYGGTLRVYGNGSGSAFSADTLTQVASGTIIRGGSAAPGERISVSGIYGPAYVGLSLPEANPVQTSDLVGYWQNENGLHLNLTNAKKTSGLPNGNYSGTLTDLTGAMGKTALDVYASEDAAGITEYMTLGGGCVPAEYSLSGDGKLLSVRCDALGIDCTLSKTDISAYSDRKIQILDFIAEKQDNFWTVTPSGTLSEGECFCCIALPDSDIYPIVTEVYYDMFDRYVGKPVLIGADGDGAVEIEVGVGLVPDGGLFFTSQSCRFTLTGDNRELVNGGAFFVFKCNGSAADARVSVSGEQYPLLAVGASKFEPTAELVINAFASKPDEANWFTLGANKYKTWWIREKGKITVGGTGAIPDYSEYASPFYNDKTVTSVVFGNGVTSVGSYLFNGCTALTDVTVPASVGSIGSGAFSQTKVGKLRIDGITEWCGTEFGNKSSSPLSGNASSKTVYVDGEPLTELVIPASVTQIPAYAFSGWDMISYVTLPDTLISIGESAFEGTSVKKLYIGSVGSWLGVTLGNAASNPLGNTGADKKLYVGGKETVSVTIPADATQIKAYSFYNWDMIKTVTSKRNVPQSCGTGAFHGLPSDCVIYVPVVGLQAYKMTWSEVASRIYGAYFVTLDANGGTGEQEYGAAIVPVEGDCVFTLPVTSRYTRSGRSFEGWSETPDGNAIASGTLTLTGDKTLYAVWGYRHVHGNWNVSVNDNVIMTVCGESGCTLAGNTVLLLVYGAGGEFDGVSSYGASLYGWTDFSAAHGLTEPPEIVYSSSDGVLQGAPSEPGTYTASVTVCGVTAKNVYEITDNTVCKIKETGRYYGSIESAAEAALDGQTIIVTRDCTAARTEFSGKNLTLSAGDDNVTLTLTGPLLFGAKDGNNTFILTGSAKGTLTVTPEKTEDVNAFRPIAVRKGNVLIIKEGALLTGSALSLAVPDDNYGGMINVSEGAVCELDGGVISDCTAYYGGAVSVSGTFRMKKGSIENCHALLSPENGLDGRGGAVFVTSAGTFEMSGGSVKNCVSDVAGGAVYSYGTVVISGNALISGCGASGNAEKEIVGKGGGVYILSGKLYMSGGSVTGNTAGSDGKGGGIYLAAAAEMLASGGSVTGNLATGIGGGIYLHGDAPAFLTVSGSVVISDNTAGFADNILVCPEYGNVITVAEAGLSAGAVIHVTPVTAENAPASGDSPLAFTSNGKAADVGFFVSDIEDTAVYFDNGALYVGKKPDAALISAPEAVLGLVYTGNDLTLITAGECSGGTLLYSLDGEAWSDKLPKAKKAGEYTVYLKIEADEQHVSVTLDGITVTVGKAPNAVTGLEDQTVVFGTSPETPSALALFGSVVYKYYTDENCTEGESSLLPVDAGVYRVKAYVPGTGDYEEASQIAVMEITPKPLSDTAEVGNVSDKPETGEPIEPTVSVKDGEKILVKDKDFTASYENNTDAGEGKIRIVFIGNYSGEKTITFGIKHVPEKKAGKAAECETDGYSEYYGCKCGKYFEDEACTVVISDLDEWKTSGNGKLTKLGHSYGAPEYVWEGSACTASAVCAGCENVRTEKADGIYVKDTDATDTEPEKGHYEASFDDPSFEDQFTENNSVEMKKDAPEDENPEDENPDDEEPDNKEPEDDEDTEKEECKTHFMMLAALGIGVVLYALTFLAFRRKTAAKIVSAVCTVATVALIFFGCCDICMVMVILNLVVSLGGLAFASISDK